MAHGWCGHEEAQGGRGTTGHDALCLLGSSDVPRGGDRLLSWRWFPLSPLPAALVGIAGGNCAALVPSGRGNPNNVPRARRSAKAMANAMAFFARMDACICWREGGCGNNGGDNVCAGGMPVARVGTATARGSRASGGMTTATGSTITVTGGTMTATGGITAGGTTTAGGRKRQQQHHHQRTNHSTIVRTFTSPDNLDLFKLIYRIDRGLRNT